LHLGALLRVVNIIFPARETRKILESARLNENATYVSEPELVVDEGAIAPALQKTETINRGLVGSAPVKFGNGIV